MSKSDDNVIYLDPEVVDKEREVLLYRQAGLTFEQIAKKVGYASHTGAIAAFKRAIERIRDDGLAAEGRVLHRARLESALQAIWPKVVKGDLPAIDRMLKILERDAKLYGLDMPVKTETEVTTYDGNLLRQRTREIVAAIREVRRQESSLGDGSSEAGTASE
jgi:hypothetical protein